MLACPGPLLADDAGDPELSGFEHALLFKELPRPARKGLALAEQLIESLRSQRVIVPTVTMIDRLCAEALARGVKLLYQRLTQSLDGDGRAKLDALLLPREDLRTVVLTWLRQPPGEPKARNVLAHLDRLHRIREVKLSANLSQVVHQGRMAQLAREGAQMSAQHLRDLENRRRHATLIAVLLDTEATITDQILDMHDRIVGRMFNEAKRKHEQSFADSGRAINEKVRLYVRVGHALIDARQKSGSAAADWSLAYFISPFVKRPLLLRELPVERHGELIRRAMRWPSRLRE